jgi:hypothetical protein
MGGTAGERHGLEHGPATPEVAEDRRVVVLKPWPHVRAKVLQGAGKAMGAPDLVADHAPAMFDEVFERTQRGTLGREGWPRVAVGESAFE